MADPRVTQREIAIKAGVGRTAVSLALKDHPKISKPTKARILKVAKSLGYVPDPMLSALAAYRTQKRTRAYQGSLVWLANATDDFKWRQASHYLGYYEGAKERAAFHGYQLEEFTLEAGAISPTRVGSILRARNVNGILLCPQGKPDMDMAFPWDGFAVVTFGYSLRSPLLNTVASAHFLNTRNTLRRLLAQGYCRVGLLIDRRLDERCGSNICAGFLIEQELNKNLTRIPPLLDYDSTPEHRAAYATLLASYVRQHKLDAIVTADYSILGVLHDAGLRVPEDIGVAGISLSSRESKLAGIVEDCAKIGAIAVDKLVGMVQRGEYGVPPMPIRTHLEGTWHDGETLKPRHLR
jgi:DNA-binding LacI/PurR family transcriptional regulator